MQRELELHNAILRIGFTEPEGAPGGGQRVIQLTAPNPLIRRVAWLRATFARPVTASAARLDHARVSSGIVRLQLPCQAALGCLWRRQSLDLALSVRFRLHS